MSIQKNKKITITAQGPFLHGTVTSYSNQCGKEGCHCKNDLDHRHGPYYRWGGKINGKYVSKVISKEIGWECKKRINNFRTLLEKIENIKEMAIKKPPWDP